MAAVRNKRLLVFQSSVEAGSSLNLDAVIHSIGRAELHLDAMLSANAVRTSLSANDSHWIR